MFLVVKRDYYLRIVNLLFIRNNLVCLKKIKTKYKRYASIGFFFLQELLQNQLKMKLTILTVLLFVFSLVAIYTSVAPWNLNKFTLIFLGLSIVTTILCSLFLNVWFKGSFIERFKKSFKIALALNFASFLLGYSFILAKTLILL
jgi:hypothetical protein